MQIIDAETARGAKPARSYVARHWAGELSLPISYWANCFLLSWMFHVAVLLVPADIDFTSAPFVAIVFPLLWLLLGAITVWQFTGAWRSAGHHPQRGGSRIWAGLARVAILLGACSYAGTVIKIGIPQSVEYTKVALGLDDFAQVRLQVSEDRRTLLIEGGIGFGLTGKVASVLQYNPQITTIELASIGGRVQEARKLGELVRARGLNTVVVSGCHSACTLIFMGGTERRISPDGQLGFHRYSFPGAGPRDFEESEAADSLFLASRGVSRDFIARVYRTPNTDLWQPSHAELFKARVVTGYAISPRDEEDFRRGLASNPLFQVIHEFERDTFEEVARRGLDLFRQGRVDEIRSVALPLVLPLYKKHLPRASEDALKAAWNVAIEQGRALKAVDPDLCFQYYKTDGTPGPEIVSRLPKESIDREFNAMALVIRSGATARRAPPAPQQIDKDISRIVELVGKRLGPRMALAQASSAPTREHRLAQCDMTILFLEEIAALPGPKATTLMRAVLTDVNQ